MDNFIYTAIKKTWEAFPLSLTRTLQAFQTCFIDRSRKETPYTNFHSLYHTMSLVINVSAAIITAIAAITTAIIANSVNTVTFIRYIFDFECQEPSAI